MKGPARLLFVGASIAAVTVFLRFRERWPALDKGSGEPGARVRAYLDTTVVGSKTPGLQYVVVSASGTLFDYAGGLADIRRASPMTPDTTMMAYSMSKTITAAAVLRLVDEGRVGLDDPIRQYVEDVPYGPGVTVRRLLSHTAGLPNPIPLGWVHPASEHERFDERASLARVLEKHRTLASEPGTKYQYSNLGYWLLGPLVEKASAEPFSRYVEHEILAPLGITPDRLGYTIVDPARHASGYLEKYSFMNLAKRLVIDAAYIDRYDGSWLRLNSHCVNGAAFGGLVGTAASLGVFLQDQLAPASRVLSERARTLFYERQHATAGSPIPMTLGWHVAELAGEPYFFKEGGGGGFHSMMRLYPARGIGSVMIANATGVDVKHALDRTDPLFLHRGGTT